VRERAEAVFVSSDAFFSSRGVQISGLAARDKIPTACARRDMVAAGALMSYSANPTEAFHQAGIYTGNILKGAKPADLPVVQSVKFEFVLNLQTARLLNIEVPPSVLALADEAIE
jgi:putative tryptophan/tyrosine transport system substrate-binding protein